MRNNKGMLPVVWAFLGIATVVAGICITRIPSWSRAKAAHCEAEYQSGNTTCGDTK